MANTVLIVEDDEMIGRAMGQRLRSFGFNVHRACDLDIAGQIAEENHPDVVLLDINLADEAKYPGNQELANADWAADVPFVLVAGAKQMQVQRLADQLGAYGLLKKPFSGNDLLDSVSDALWQEPEAANDP